ncbi:DUF1963 domain-containing protein [Roseivirga sp. UBA1976]|uniref:DUF1963 domain-containing protein n=1 Tax=Roseivirga sp. UBA1976 TaxID=1947386 RepID=UPI00338EED6B
MPRNFIWPSHDGFQLLFVCQINLNELRNFSCSRMFPYKGMLYSFMGNHELKKSWVN